jgi:hypothetical protein
MGVDVKVRACALRHAHLINLLEVKKNGRRRKSMRMRTAPCASHQSVGGKKMGVDVKVRACALRHAHFINLLEVKKKIGCVRKIMRMRTDAMNFSSTFWR